MTDFWPEGATLPEGFYFKLGQQTLSGQELVLACEGQQDIVVDLIKGKPIALDRWIFPEGQGWKEYYDLYLQAIRTEVPELVIVQNKEQRQAILKNKQQPFQVSTLPEGGNILIAGRNEKTMLLAPQGSGKSWAALFCLANLKVPALYVATESLEDILERQDLMEQAVKTDWTNISVVSQPDTSTIGQVVEEADRIQAQIVVVDVLSDFLIDENQQSSWHEFVALMKPLLEGRSTLIVHHTGKNKLLGARGHSKIGDVMFYDYILQPAWPSEYRMTIAVRPYKKNRGTMKAKGLQLIVDHPESNNGFFISAEPLPANQLAIEQWHKAWTTAKDLTGKGALPSVAKLADQVARLTGLGKNKARDMVEEQINIIFKIVPDGGYNKHPGITLIEDLT